MAWRIRMMADGGVVAWLVLMVGKAAYGVPYDGVAQSRGMRRWLACFVMCSMTLMGSRMPADNTTPLLTCDSGVTPWPAANTARQTKPPDIPNLFANMAA